MEKFYTMQEFEESVTVIRKHTDITPKVGLILGSGLNALAESVEDPVQIPYKQIPHYPVSTVAGHQGRLVLGHLEGQPVMIMQGRAHYYEGYPMSQIGLPVRVMQLMGVEILIVTNAAGGVNLTYRPGDVMIIRDHINLIGMAGLNPLRGPNLAQFGPRFPNMNNAYDLKLREVVREVALKAQIPYHEGVYICLAGPSFETVADVRFVRVIGADAVGMSTVPEVTVARHGGIRVLGLSGITNTLSGEDPIGGGLAASETSASESQGPNHEEVLEAGKILIPRMETLIRGVLQSVGQSAQGDRGA
jgi:purine-nucleoside phosphorylase